MNQTNYIYGIWRTQEGVRAIVVDGIKRSDLPHAGGEQGFNYGFRGSGPHHLALSLLAHALGESEIYNSAVGGFLSHFLSNRFKEEVVAAISASAWSTSQEIIKGWVGQSIKCSVEEYIEQRDKVKDALSKMFTDAEEDLTSEQLEALDDYLVWVRRQRKDEVMS